MAKFGNLATSQTAQLAQTSAHTNPSAGFFKLTATIAEEIRAAKLTAAEWNFWSYLVTLDPFGDRGVEFDPATVILQLGMSKSTYFSAKAKFQRLGWFDFKDGKTTVRNCRGLNSPELRDIFRSGGPKFRSRVQDSGVEPKVEDIFRSDSPKFRSDTPRFRSPVQDFGVESEISEFSESEPLSQTGSSASQTNSDLDQTDLDKEEREVKNSQGRVPNQGEPSSPLDQRRDKQPGYEHHLGAERQDQEQGETRARDFKSQSKGNPPDSEQNLQAKQWDQFSAPGAEPEFFEFVVRRTAKLPKPPADPLCAAEGWIRKQGHILYPQYLEWKAEQEQASKRRQVHPVEMTPLLIPEPEQMTSEQWLERYQQMWQAGPGVQPYICRAIAQHPERGLQIGKNGPELVPG